MACLLAAAAFAAYVLAFAGYVPDDVFITLRVARHWVEGAGLVFNPGERVEVYSNPLWVVVSGGLLVLPMIGSGAAALAAASQALSALCAAGALLVVVFWAPLAFPGREDARHTLRGLAALAALLVAVSPDFTVNAVSGMETGLLALLVTAALFLQARTELDGVWRGAGVLWGLAALTHPEAALIAALSGAVGFALAPSRGVIRRAAALEAAAFSAIVVVHLVFRFTYYDGELVPNTFWAKLGGTPFDRVTYLREALWPGVLGLVGVAAAAAGWLHAAAERRRGLRWVLQVVILISPPLLVGSDWMLGHRFVAPFLPSLAAICLFGWARLLAGRQSRYVLPGAAVLVLGVGALHTTELEELGGRLSYQVAVHGALEREAELLCGEGAPPLPVLAASDIGLVSFRCSRTRVIDLSGLADRHIGKSPGGFMTKTYDPGYVLDQHPDAVALATVERVAQDEPSFGLLYPVENQLFRADGFQAYRRTWAPSEIHSVEDSLAAIIGADHVIPNESRGPLVYRPAVFRRAKAMP